MTELEKHIKKILDNYTEVGLCDTPEKKEVAKKWAIYYAHVFAGEGWKVKRPDDSEEVDTR